MARLDSGAWAPAPKRTSAVHPYVARSIQRQAVRERIHARVVHPIDTPRLLRDPLERRESKAVSALTGMRLLAGAATIHGALIVCFALVSSLVGEHATYKPPERLKVSIVETPPVEPPPVVEPPKQEAPVEPEFAPKELPKPVEPQRKTPPKEVAPPAPEATPDPPQRRTVGLSLESTVEGKGPAFATGSTRMGVTNNQAVEPKLAARAPSAAVTAAPPAVTSNIQRAAARIPGRDVEFEKPKRVRPNRPEYPAALKAQGLEGDVVVSVDITAGGKVTNVTVVRSSGEPAFDEAARRAALSEQFSPATRGGQPVAFTLSYSYRFRIKD
jgi:periplasmic protein TonB